jgi:hypothetical protein
VTNLPSLLESLSLVRQSCRFKTSMTKSLCVIAILAAAVSTTAMAKDIKQDKKDTAPTVAATQMSDAEMDKVTAGVAYVTVNS